MVTQLDTIGTLKISVWYSSLCCRNWLVPLLTNIKESPVMPFAIKSTPLLRPNLCLRYNRMVVALQHDIQFSDWKKYIWIWTYSITVFSVSQIAVEGSWKPHPFWSCPSLQLWYVSLDVLEQSFQQPSGKDSNDSSLQKLFLWESSSY